jgi:hypothetical protein
MNRHPTFLGVLGILPNQLRTLLKETGYENREEALLDLSRTLFFAGFRIWKKRNQLANLYWNEVGQRLSTGTAKKRKKRKKKNTDQDNFESKCQNPFHYLPRHANLSKQRPTKCPCRNVVATNKIFTDQPITKFVFKYKKSRKNASESDRKTSLRRRKKKKSSLKNNLFITRTDAIRKEHDRGKKRPLKQLTVDRIMTKKQRR